VAKKTKKTNEKVWEKLKETQKRINDDSWVTALLGIYFMNPYMNVCRLQQHKAR